MEMMFPTNNAGEWVCPSSEDESISEQWEEYLLASKMRDRTYLSAVLESPAVADSAAVLESSAVPEPSAALLQSVPAFNLEPNQPGRRNYGTIASGRKRDGGPSAYARGRSFVTSPLNRENRIAGHSEKAT